MRVLVACEHSGRVRDAFCERGHEAMSCDLLPSDSPGWHYQGDVRDVLQDGWDIMIGHPPCTFLAVSGARWFSKRLDEQKSAVEFVKQLWDAPIHRVAIENPISVLSTRWMRPSQIIQPWQHGHGETKATCLWLRNLPHLLPSNVVTGRSNRIHRMPPSADRAKLRSITYMGIARAMAEQWGGWAE